MKFYICKTCGKIIAIVKDAPAPTMCCGQKMEEIVPGTTDAAVEKHVPVFEIKDQFLRSKIKGYLSLLAKLLTL